MLHHKQFFLSGSSSPLINDFASFVSEYGFLFVISVSVIPAGKTRHHCIVIVCLQKLQGLFRVPDNWKQSRYMKYSGSGIRGLSPDK